MQNYGMPAPTNSSASVVSSGTYQPNAVGLQAHMNYQDFQQQRKLGSGPGSAAGGGASSNQANEMIKNAHILKPVEQLNRASETLLAKNRFTTDVEDYRKVFVGKIPNDVSNEFMERLLGSCGPIQKFQRGSNQNGQLRNFGFLQYEQVESVFQAWKLLDGIEILDSKISIRLDEKTRKFFSDWVEGKRQQWLTQQQKLGLAVDLEDLAQKEAAGVLTPYELEMISNYKDVKRTIDETLRRRELIDDVAIANNQGKGSESFTIFGSESDPLLKYKQHERELKREQRIKDWEFSEMTKFKRRLSEWLDFERKRKDEEQNKIRREADKARERERLIQKDLNYDSGEEKKWRKKHPDRWAKIQEERKKIRELEREEDLAEMKKEEEERKKEEQRRIEQAAQLQEQLKREEEMRERLRQKRFIQMQQSTEEAEAAYKRAKLNEEQDKVIKVEQPDEQRQEEHSTTLTALPESVINNIQKLNENLKEKRQQEQQQKKLKLTDYLDNPDKMAEVAKCKELLPQIPRDPQEIMDTKIDWESLNEHDTIEKICRPWIGRKMKEYLSKSEPAIIQMIIKQLNNSKVTPQKLLTRLASILDEDTDQFVKRLWQVLIYEELKVKAKML